MPHKYKIRKEQINKLFFASDFHFQHNNILRYENRPFKSIEDMKYGLVRNWNKTVPWDGMVFILGDFSWNNEKEFKWLNKVLRGKKIFLKGNHDHMKICKTWPDIIEIKVEDDSFPGGLNKIVCSHYPMESWNASAHGSWHLHGHVHSRPISLRKNRYHVGVDTNNYKPISYRDIKLEMAMTDIRSIGGKK